VFNAKEKKVSNKIKTAGYFIKRLKDSGFVVFKIFNAYSDTDPRRWTVLIDPGITSVFVTCYNNKNEINEVLFEIDDGGNLFSRGTFYKTDSIETIISVLITKGVNNDAKKNPFSLLK
jgi:hypothetical protein